MVFVLNWMSDAEVEAVSKQAKEKAPCRKCPQSAEIRLVASYAGITQIRFPGLAPQRHLSRPNRQHPVQFYGYCIARKKNCQVHEKKCFFAALSHTEAEERKIFFGKV